MSVCGCGRLVDRLERWCSIIATDNQDREFLPRSPLCVVGKHARCARDDEWWPNCACDCHVDTAEAIAAIVRDCTEYDPDSSLGRRLAERIAGLLASEGNK